MFMKVSALNFFHVIVGNILVLDEKMQISENQMQIFGVVLNWE